MIAHRSFSSARTVRALAVLILGALGVTAAVAATQAACCDAGAGPERWVSCRFEVPEDGIVPLRDAPSFDAAVVVRMDPVDGWFLAATTGDRAIVEGAWMYVLYVPPIALGSEGVESLGRSGWMHRSLEAGCDA